MKYARHLIAALLLLLLPVGMQADTRTLSLAPYPYHQFFTNAGAVAASHKLFVYYAGTTTKSVSYQTSSTSGSVNANPIVLDSAGRASIWLDPTIGPYKFVLAPANDTDPPAAAIWTQDNIAAVHEPFTTEIWAGTAGETIQENRLCYLSDGSGGNTAGRWYKADFDAATVYEGLTAQTLGFMVTPGGIFAGESGQFRVAGIMDALSGLSAGSIYSAGSGGTLTLSSSLAGNLQRRVGQALSSTTLVMTPWHQQAPAIQTSDIVIRIDNIAGGTITTGPKRYVYMSHGFYVTGWTAIADQSCSIVVDVWKDTYANALPTVADTIAGSELPTIAAAVKGQDASLSSWTNYVAAGSVLGFNVDSVATCTFVEITLQGYVIT